LTEKGKLLKSASVVALITVISRVCGYLRDQRVALLLGTSPVADSFILAFRIPNMIRRITGEGALGASFIPVFTGYLRAKSQRETWAFAQRMFWDAAVVLAVLSILGCVFSRQVIGIFTLMGVNHVHWDLAVYLNRIIFPCILFLGLTALGSGILNSFRQFALPAWSGVTFNLVVIVSSFAIVYQPVMKWAPDAYRSPAVALAAGILVASVASLAIQLPALRKLGMSFRPDVNFQDPGVRKTGKLMAPVFFGAGVFQINFFIDTIFATSSRMPSGSITSLYVSDRVMELVLGVYAMALSTVIFPTMSHQAADGKYEEMKQTFGFALRIVSFITIPAAIGLILLRVPITQVLFQHGEFGARSTALTSHALLFYSLGLPAFAAIKLITPMYYSTHDTLTPTKVGIYSLALHILLNVILLFAFGSYLWNASPALASSLSAYFNFAALFIIFRGRYGRLGATAILASLGKMIICAAAMAVACFAALRYSHFEAIEHFASRAGMLVAMMALSVGVYFALANLLRCEELPELFLLLRRPEPEAVGLGIDV
jgi:putative peptidoglycan lipid II flippase